MIPTERQSASSQIVRVGFPSTCMTNLMGQPSFVLVLSCFEIRQKRRRGVVDTYKIYRESVDGLPQFWPEPVANPTELFGPRARRREDHASPYCAGGRARFRARAVVFLDNTSRRQTGRRGRVRARHHGLDGA